jgi:hypothetical protein
VHPVSRRGNAVGKVFYQSTMLTVGGKKVAFLVFIKINIFHQQKKLKKFVIKKLV